MIEYNILARYMRFARRARCVSAFVATTTRRARSATRSAARDAPTAAKQRVETAELKYDVGSGSNQRIPHEFRRTPGNQSAKPPARGRARRAPMGQAARVRRVAEARTSRYLGQLAASTRRR